MKTTKTIIIDIDNTILDQKPRKKKILESLGITYINDSDIFNDFHLQPLQGQNRDLFNINLYGDNYSDKLVPFEHAKEVIEDLVSDGFKIHYLTSRPKEQKEITVQLLNNHGFPTCEEKNIKFSFWENSRNVRDYEYSDIISESINWRKKKIEEIVATEDVLCGVDDLAQNVSIMSQLGIPSILFHSHSPLAEIEIKLKEYVTNEFIIKSINIVETWDSVASIIKQLSQGEEELKELIQLHTREYTSFLSDLDNKARQLLIVSVFIATCFFAILQQKLCNTIIILLSCSGLLICLFSFIFSMRAFGSRHTRGRRTGATITYDFKFFVKNFFKVLIGTLVYDEESPIGEAQLARIEKGVHLRKLSHLAYFQKSYGTFDPDIIRNQRMLDMRALNYEKICPEIYARRLIYLSIIILFSTLIFYLLS
jgi:hypothetical protein